MSFQRAGFIVLAVQEPCPERVAEKQKCSYVAVKPASAFLYKPTDEWRIPEPRDLFNKDKSMTEQHQEEQRSTLDGLQGWSQIKVQPHSKRRGKYVPKRPQIVSTAETTLQEGLRPCGYIALSKVAMIAAVVRRSGRAPDVMRSVVAGPEPMLLPGGPGHGAEVLQYLASAGVAGLGAPKSAVEQEQDPEEVAKTRWLVLMVTETESDAVVGMRAPGRPRRQETK